MVGTSSDPDGIPGTSSGDAAPYEIYDRLFPLVLP